jgi:hypothetical protein
MNPACGCDRGEWRHHHAFGGVYPCEGPQTCIQCQPVERAPVEVIVDPNNPTKRQIRWPNGRVDDVDDERRETR